MPMKLNAKANQIIERILYASVATVSTENHPWNAPVFIASDDEYNFYWGSDKDSQHSRNITASGQAFLVIYDSAADPGKGEGVYIEAACVELTDPGEIKHAHALLWKRHVVPFWKLEQVLEPTPIRLYKATPRQIWLNTEGHKDGHYVDIRMSALEK